MEKAELNTRWVYTIDLDQLVKDNPTQWGSLQFEDDHPGRLEIFKELLTICNSVTDTDMVVAQYDTGLGYFVLQLMRHVWRMYGRPSQHFYVQDGSKRDCLGDYEYVHFKADLQTFADAIAIAMKHNVSDSHRCIVFHPSNEAGDSEKLQALKLAKSTVYRMHPAGMLIRA